MSKLSEINRFENRFTKEIIEVAAVTGASGVGAGKAGDAILWGASIPLIAWQDLCNHELIIEEKLRLEWLADDAELRRSRELLQENTVVRLLVRREENAMMLVQVLDKTYEDNELEKILQDSMKPVYYQDKILGEFTLEKTVELFEKQISWVGEECSLSFDWNKDEQIMQDALKTAYILFEGQNEWDRKMKLFAATELLELANEWLQDDDEKTVDEITQEMFINLMKLESISVYPDGDFTIYFSDGDMFWGHCIVVDGNINGTFNSAEIAG
ncbi:DUF2262 domain-containing protein [Bacillus sp. TL12]|uniref:DUF2262 domain-containing protein n=1 Tax=Bacillus sp. TL12 TaxID=2894756 RepID=UPI001F517068|nr:DUF2262 domain-containing protein [Bacillus sp. TL12]MCI0764202.1 DUF2262 domain-containing protein [Bacillus sp. TL12]